MGTLILTSAGCEDLLDHPALLAVLERAHIELACGGATQPLPVAMRAAGDRTTDGPSYVPMASYAPYLGLVGVKLLADVPVNRRNGVPAQRSTVALYSAESAECLALVDGRVVTRMRTAAVSALATRALARPRSRVLGLVGAGALAVEHVRAVRAVLDLERVVVWSRSAASRERLRAAVLADHGTDLDVETVGSVAGVLAVADVVCTLTPAEEPVVRAVDLRPGTHLNAVGSPPRPGYRELEPAVLARADVVVVDHRPVAVHESGNIGGALAAGAISPDDLVELGAVLAGSAPGRRHPDDVTVFNSVGIGLQDLAALDLLRRRALEQGLGETVNLRP